MRVLPHAVVRLRWRVQTAVLAVLMPVLVSHASNYTLSFGHNLNVWSWDQSLLTSKTLSPELSIFANGRHNKRVSESSTLSRQSTSASGRGSVTYAFTPVVRLGMEVSGSQSRQESGNSVSEVVEHSLGARFGYTPYPWLQLNQSLGRSYDKRRDVSDAGVSHTTRLSMSPVHTHDLPRLSIAFFHTGVSSRQGDALTRLDANMSHQWTDSTAQTLRFSGTTNDQRYVSSAQGNPILERLTRSRKLDTHIMSRIAWVGRVSLRGNWSSGSVDDDASGNPDDLKYRTNNTTREFGGAFAWSPPIVAPAVTCSLSASRWQRDAEDHLPAITGIDDSPASERNTLDRNRDRLQIMVSSFYAIGPFTSIRVTGLLGLSRDHTPSGKEVNDRDDYERSIVGIVRHRYAATHDLEFQVQRTETHYVWLMTDRSANNRWDRVLNLWATNTMHFGRFTLGQQGFFRTSLEEFDYDYLFQSNPRSQNLRIGRMKLDGAYTFNPKTTISTGVQVEARTRGNLVGAQPGRRPDVWELTENETAERLHASLTIAPVPSWQIMPSLSVSRTKTYIPTRTDWHPLHLGRMKDKQEGLSLSCQVRFTPRERILGGRDALILNASRTWIRRRTLRSTMDFVSLNLQHTF